ncbi:MAG: thiamine pyrophosphate-binding protein [Betaproteobacteria bacterium]|nr:thiamine pyrophosphate-binding protein [Betaproteobacteria bacterium]MDH5221919.1 thiamine pyrophosphate-binding protein [Betaproteobacteria bacterium]MDH5349877.1 thiamine pyrophosphate-binding protein [Betaproteobacteria bacterium]
MNVSDVMVGYLRAAGIGHVFGYPGDPNIEFMESVRRAGMQFVLGRREGTAGLMAEAYGFLTGRPGVCMSTLGPGSSNLVNAVANAWLDRVPMIALSGQIERKREQTFTHQVLDHNRLFSPVSKWTTHVAADTVGGIMRRALRTAMGERPGPVHITTHADVVGAEAKDAGIALPPLAASAFGGDAGIAARLKKARKPVILAGIAAQRANAHQALARLAEKAGIPVVVAPMAKGVLAEDHPYYAGTLDMACNALMWKFLAGCDLLLAVGFDAVELIKPWSLSVPTVHVDALPNTDQIYRAEVEVVGDIAAIVEGVADAWKGEPRWTQAAAKRHRDALRAAYYAGRVKGKLNPTDVIDAVREALPREAIATTDVGSHKLLVGQGWATYAPRSVLMSNGLSSMGYSLPAAMVAQMLHPTRPVVCFIGDGGLAMVQGELRLAASLKLPLLVVVFCDQSLNRIEIKQANRKYPSWGTLIEATDLELLARSMGCEGASVASPPAFERLLAGKRPKDRPLVVGARIDPAQYTQQF